MTECSYTVKIRHLLLINCDHSTSKSKAQGKYEYQARHFANFNHERCCNSSVVLGGEGTKFLLGGPKNCCLFLQYEHGGQFCVGN